ncbi:MAG: ribonuclease HII [Candidatus Omnitrophica bacterium]|nr:ribonuclease HII [Candidatus Omnitrophota bacterium]
MVEHLLNYETEAQNQGFRFVLGVDEAGRGPLAGPVVAAAVCLKSFDFTCRIDDSKKMTPAARQKAFDQISQKAYVGLGLISETAIDQVNILNATFLAMEAAVRQLVDQIRKEIRSEVLTDQVKILVDGNRFKTDLPYAYRGIIGGDTSSLSIACASIIAKTYRDRMMEHYDRIFPQYGFKAHKGYPTALHKLAILRYGPSIIHRKTFQGVLPES